MKWEDYKEQQRAIPPNRELVDVECPRCGQKIYRDTRFVLTSYPEQYRYFCEKCGWGGTA